MEEAESAFDVSRLPGYWREADARYALDGWRASGLSMAAFAEKHGLTVQKLRRWRQRLEDPTLEEGAPRFVRLLVGRERVPSSLRVHVGEFVVEVPNDFDADALTRLLQVLSC